MKTYKADPSYKITFIGMSGSGKTSIINRLVNNSFSQIYNPTFEMTEYFKKFTIVEDKFTQTPGTYVGDVNLILEDV